MKPAFNLIDEPWIPAISNKGKELKLGLRDVILKSHTLREIYDASPVVTAALYRLLLALLHRVYGPYSVADWKDLYRNKRFPREPLEKYLKKWRPRFWLFHSKHPYYQTIEPPPKVEPKGIGYMRFESADSGMVDRQRLFDHGADDYSTRIPFDMAARLLVAYQNYALGGTGNLIWETGEKDTKKWSFKDSPLSRGVFFLVKGANLFETLVLNMVGLRKDRPLPGTLTRDDRPAWEQDEWVPSWSTTPKGYLDILTWRSRRILLVRDDEKKSVVGFHRGQGDALYDDYIDPQMTILRRANRLSPLKFRTDRALWRDSTALLRLTAGGAGNGERPPEQIIWLAELVDAGHLPPSKRFDISAYGLCAERAKVHFWRRESLPIPLRYLENQGLVETLQYCLGKAEDVSRSLYSVAMDLSRKLSTREDAPRLFEHLNPQPYYWSALEPAFFRVMDDVAESGESDPEQRIVRAWVKTLYYTALEAFDTVVKDLDRSAKALKAVTEAEGYLRSMLFSEENSPLRDYLDVIKGGER